MANDKVEDLTINFEDENGVQLVREMDKEILTKGTWSTVMFKYQDLDKASGEFKAPKYAVRRYQKRDGEYRMKSKFTISSAAQAQKICEVLNRWTAGETSTGSGDNED